MLEVKVGRIESDVSEIKADVKTIVSSQVQLAINLAVKDASEVAVAKARASTGKWFRFFAERSIAAAALIVSVAVLLKEIL